VRLNEAPVGLRHSTPPHLAVLQRNWLDWTQWRTAMERGTGVVEHCGAWRRRNAIHLDTPLQPGAVWCYPFLSAQQRRKAGEGCRHCLPTRSL